MQNYRKTSHSVYDLKYHRVWITKYRKPVIFGDVRQRLRDLIGDQVNPEILTTLFSARISGNHLNGLGCE